MTDETTTPAPETATPPAPETQSPAPTETTTQAVDTAANDVKAEEPIVETDIIEHLESFGTFVESDLHKLEVWIKNAWAQI